MTRLRALGEFLGGVVKRPRAYAAAAIPIALPLLLATVNMDPAATRTTQAALLGPPPTYAELAKSPTARLPQHSVILTIEDGDTLDTIFSSGGLSQRESALLTREVARFIDVRRLRPGNLVRIHYDVSGTVDSVEVKITGWGEVDAVRAEGSETFTATPHQAEQREVEATISATIDSSLWEALRATGESPQLVQQLVDVFQWDVDFFALQRGDSFSVVVRKKYSGSDLMGYGPIVAARFDEDGDHYEAFRHEAADGHAGYYARSGAPLRKQFLRAPLQFTRITSGFSKRRFHPLLHYFRPHYGVDYGAPVGTPVMTTADGVVVETAYRPGEGNCVRIRHNSQIETSYLHLSRFSRNVRRGARVTQGDVIGFVGTTGLSTGPHLDYRVRDNGSWIDPLKLKSITPDPLRSAELAHFRGNVARLLPRLSGPTDQVAQLAAKRRALF